MISMKRINARSNDELNILLDALIDYEILCRLYELTSNDHSYSRSILLLAMEKLYYAINLGQFPDHNIGILSLISTVNNIHLFDKRYLSKNHRSKRHSIISYFIPWINCYMIFIILKICSEYFVVLFIF